MTGVPGMSGGEWRATVLWLLLPWMNMAAAGVSAGRSTFLGCFCLWHHFTCWSTCTRLQTWETHLRRSFQCFYGVWMWEVVFGDLTWIIFLTTVWFSLKKLQTVKKSLNVHIDPDLDLKNSAWIHIKKLLFFLLTCISFSTQTMLPWQLKWCCRLGWRSKDQKKIENRCKTEVGRI